MSQTLTASALLDRFWDGHLPVKPELIAAALGIVVHASNDPAHSGEVRQQDGRVEIRVNACEALVRQRFTIAHEIGHFALGHLAGSTALYRDTPAEFSMNAGQEEVAANAFAAELLMPERILRFVITEKGVQQLTKLAELFGVSQAAMQYRLKNIGIIA